MISSYYEAVLVGTMIAFILGMFTGALTVPYLKNKKKVDKKLEKIWKRTKIVSVIIFKMLGEIGMYWVFGMSLILLTRLYAESNLPKGLFSILWILGVVFLAVKFGDYILKLGDNK